MSHDMQIIADRWMLNSRCLINWGSYDGYHEFRPSTDAMLPVTLLAGASESGKSTLVDAQISLLYPTGTPFNKASNTGRSERSDYTYLRGMLGYDNTGNGDVPVFLRGRRDDGTPQPVWGAIVDTYVNHTTGQTLSCGKFLYLSAGDGQGDVRRQYVTWDHTIDPRLMDRYRDTPFTPTQLKNTYVGCDTFPNADAFHTYIWRVMGLSAEACRLLHKLQSADAPSRLDDIFKQGVLGVPEAIGLAQSAVSDYERYDTNFRSMAEKTQRIERLTAIQHAYDAYATALQNVHDFAPVDPESEQGNGHATIVSWVTNRMTGEVRKRVPIDVLALKRKEQDLESLQRQADAMRDRVSQIETQLNNHDEGSLTRLEAQLKQAEITLQDVTEQRDRLQTRFATAGMTMPDDAQSWESCRADIATLSVELNQRKDSLTEQRNTAVRMIGEAKRTLAALRQDYDRQRRQRTRISQPMDEARSLLAQATGLSTDELPYVAELMDVREDAEEWRNAMNVVYGQLAQTILVDKRHEAGFAAKVSTIDPKRMIRRTWTFVDTTRDYIADGEKAWMSGKLRYREDSPFVDWLKSQTSSERLDALCVDDIDDESATRQVQRDGQIKSGRYGHHGSKGLHPVIGFVTESYLDELRSQFVKAEARLSDAEDDYREADAGIDLLRAKEELADQLSYTTWDKIDVDGAEQRISELRTTIDSLRDDPELAHLLDARRNVQQQLDAMQEQAIRAKMDRDEIQQAIQTARQWLDEHRGVTLTSDTSGHLADAAIKVLTDAYEHVFSSVLNPEDRAGLIVTAANRTAANKVTTDEESKRSKPGETFVERAVSSVEKEIRQKIARLRENVDATRKTVEDRMTTYHSLYVPDDNTITTTVTDYQFYQEELKSLNLLAATTATNEEYVNCLDKLLMDFTQLNRAIDADARDIDDQLDKINAMLKGQQFGPRHGSLSIGADVRRPEATFTGPLKRTMTLLSEWKAGSRVSPEENRRVFAKCAGLVNRLRTELEQVRDANGIRSYGARNLDPRCRSSFYAIVHHKDGPDERITSTGGKSGGALQELTSFVYGAALIYLLGGDVTGQPTYTTLFLDEALIKADGRYTQRALSVLPRLGFQVIVSAPESKTAEILEVSSKAYVAYRDPDTSRSYLQEVLPE
ncbi:ATP-binding protein [Bifidobacterium sp. UTCIF-39]|uniref:ATP-binding protein n=1 Tax=Bifidobacterium sp. UTCIF-39 TaxID=1465359 RepID=UPI0011273B29|nr:SbcC/MukB-like Walker B domain-containing protein [Bifidobacterium sp. UTCIF-39]